jgi:hypothetical protein
MLLCLGGRFHHVARLQCSAPQSVSASRPPRARDRTARLIEPVDAWVRVCSTTRRREPNTVRSARQSRSLGGRSIALGTGERGAQPGVIGAAGEWSTCVGGAARVPQGRALTRHNSRTQCRAPWRRCGVRSRGPAPPPHAALCRVVSPWRASLVRPESDEDGTPPCVAYHTGGKRERVLLNCSLMLRV